MKQLKFIGIDGWDRAVYKDEDGMLWKDIECLPPGSPNCRLYDVSDNDFDGEPGWPMDDAEKIMFVK